MFSLYNLSSFPAPPPVITPSSHFVTKIISSCRTPEGQPAGSLLHLLQRSLTSSWFSNSLCHVGKLCPGIFVPPEICVWSQPTTAPEEQFRGCWTHPSHCASKGSPLLTQSDAFLCILINNAPSQHCNCNFHRWPSLNRRLLILGRIRHFPCFINLQCNSKNLWILDNKPTFELEGTFSVNFKGQMFRS